MILPGTIVRTTVVFVYTYNRMYEEMNRYRYPKMAGCGCKCSVRELCRLYNSQRTLLMNRGLLFE